MGARRGRRNKCERSGGAEFHSISFAAAHNSVNAVCKTRIIRENRGYIWNRRVAVHPLKDGRLQITPVRTQ
jgi:hypothetical protein